METLELSPEDKQALIAALYFAEKEAQRLRDTTSSNDHRRVMELQRKEARRLWYLVQGLPDPEQ